MSDTSDSIAASAEVVTAIGALKSSIFFGLAVIALGILGVVVLFIVLRHREKMRERADDAAKERRKDERSTAFQQALQSNADAVHALIAEQRSNHASNHAVLSGVSEMMGGFAQIMQRVETVVHTILSKQDGELSLEQTIELADCMFRLALKEKMCSIIAQSLIENDYLKRKDFIRQKVKTEMGEAIAAVRGYLVAVPSRVNIRKFFIVQDNPDHAERFILCDQMWDACESLFRDSSELTHRLDQLRYRATNTINDYFDGVRASLIQSGAHRAIHRTPLPLPERAVG